MYDASGKLIGEYSTNLNPSPQVSYLTNDHLGSPRINTNESGAVISRHDYHPFGEEVTSGRSSDLGYDTPDDVRKQFTGYERDYETGLDFAQARTYVAAKGRFNQADPIMMSKEHPPNPQRWNAYIYVLNAPTVATDPDGKKPRRNIDVFLTAKEDDPESWKAVQRYASRHNAKINIYTLKDGTATLERFKTSVEKKGNTVIVVGHSYVPQRDHDAAERGTGTVAGKGVGIRFAGGTEGVASVSAQARGFMVGDPTLEGLDAKAKNLVVLTCDFGDTFAPVSSSNKTNFLWAAGGNDGLTTTIGTIEKVGRKMAEIFARGGSAREAQNAGSAILALAPDNDGETMIREVFQPRKEEE